MKEGDEKEKAGFPSTAEFARRGSRWRIPLVTRNFGHLAGPQTTHKIFHILSIHSILRGRTEGHEGDHAEAGRVGVCATRVEG